MYKVGKKGNHQVTSELGGKAQIDMAKVNWYPSMNKGDNMTLKIDKNGIVSTKSMSKDS